MSKAVADEDLVRGCLRNNRKYQKILFEKYFSDMMKVCQRYAHDEDEAGEILQKGFIKVFAKLESYGNTGSLEGWIKRVMIRTAIDHFRMQQRENKAVILELETNDMPEDATVENTLAAEDILLLVQTLAPVQRTVFNLFALEGYTHKEISEELKISEGTSKWHLCEARKILKKALAPAYPNRVKEYAA
ncbi:MAG: RNA polymerase sigma factor [Bacteroidia bacterium]